MIHVCENEMLHVCENIILFYLTRRIILYEDLCLSKMRSFTFVKNKTSHSCKYNIILLIK